MNLLITSRVSSKSSSKVLAELNDETVTPKDFAGMKAEAVAGSRKRAARDNFIVSVLANVDRPEVSVVIITYREDGRMHRRRKRASYTLGADQ
jgi:hypothetical protein